MNSPRMVLSFEGACVTRWVHDGSTKSIKSVHQTEGEGAKRWNEIPTFNNSFASPTITGEGQRAGF